MCLVFFALKTHPDWPLVLAGNRDEFYERPTARACFWPEAPQMLAGKDLKENGTWMGVTRQGRWAVITNYRDPASLRQGVPSRGGLVSGFLLGDAAPESYLLELEPSAGRYNGFSLIAGAGGRAWFFSNHGAGVRALGPGIYGLSNRLLDTPWPKVERAKKALRAFLPSLAPAGAHDFSGLFEILSDAWTPPDHALPDTGVGRDWERMLSPVFIKSPVYGTRSCTVLAFSRKGEVFFEERSMDPDKAGSLPAANPPARFFFTIENERET